MNKQKRFRNSVGQLSDQVIMESDFSSEEDESTSSRPQSQLSLRVLNSQKNTNKLSQSQNLVSNQMFNKYLLNKNLANERNLKIFKNQLKDKAKQLCNKPTSFNFSKHTSQDNQGQLISDGQRVTLRCRKSSGVSRQSVLIQQNIQNNQVQSNKEQEFKNGQNLKKTCKSFMPQRQSFQEKIQNQAGYLQEKLNQNIKRKDDQQNLIKYVVYTCLDICMIAIFQIINNICSKGF